MIYKNKRKISKYSGKRTLEYVTKLCFLNWAPLSPNSVIKGYTRKMDMFTHIYIFIHTHIYVNVCIYLYILYVYMFYLCMFISISYILISAWQVEEKKIKQEEEIFCLKIENPSLSNGWSQQIEKKKGMVLITLKNPTHQHYSFLIMARQMIFPLPRVSLHPHPSSELG